MPDRPPDRRERALPAVGMRRPQNETHLADDPGGSGHHAGCRCSCCFCCLGRFRGLGSGARGPRQPGRVSVRWAEGGLRDAGRAGSFGELRGHHPVRRGLPGDVHRRRRVVELGVPGRVPAQLLGPWCARRLPGQGHLSGRGGLPRVHRRHRRPAVPPAGGQRRAVLHLRAGRPGRRSVRPGPPARQPDRRDRLGLRGPVLRQQRQPARHAEEDRRAGERGGRLVRRRRRVREVRLHGQLRRRAHADRGPRLPGLLPGPATRGRVRPAVDHQAVESGAQGAVRAGRDRQWQRQQHHPGRLQLLVPAPGRGPDER